ncbi:MAG: phosphotransferase family protein [Hyphomonadaceae bacterium]
MSKDVREAASREPHEKEDVHRLDEARLNRYLGERLQDGQGALRAHRLKGGASNPTYILFAGERPLYVLRKKPPGVLLPSAHQIEREYRVMAALDGTDVPVPRMRLLCEDASIIGTAFYVMDFIDGRIFRDPKLPDLSPAERTLAYESFTDVMVKLHSVDPDKVGLADFGRPGSYFERQIARWIKQYRGAQTEEIPAMERLIAELPGRLPATESVSVAHGDFRMENMMFHPSEPRVIALLDWELCTLGSPLADLGFACIGYHATIPGFGALDNVDFAMSGIPDEAAFVAAYCKRTGRTEISNWPFYVAFALFRLASISQGVFKRGLDGIGTRAEDREVNLAPYIAGRGVAMLDRL